MVRKVTLLYGSNVSIVKWADSTHFFDIIIVSKIHNFVNFRAINMNMILQCWSSISEQIFQQKKSVSNTLFYFFIIFKKIMGKVTLSRGDSTLILSKIMKNRRIEPGTEIF